MPLQPGERQIEVVLDGGMRPMFGSLLQAMFWLGVINPAPHVIGMHYRHNHNSNKKFPRYRSAGVKVSNSDGLLEISTVRNCVDPWDALIKAVAWAEEILA